MLKPNTEIRNLMKFELVFIFLEVTTLAKKLCSPGKKLEENVFTPTNKYKKIPCFE